MAAPHFEFQEQILHAEPIRLYGAFGKRFADLAIVLLLAPLAILMIALAAGATALSGGNPFYSQMRVGRGGARFRMWKIRTMVRDADQKLSELLARDPVLRDEWERTQKLARDPRITRVGRFLRRTSLDELPQLLNVVNGTMSIVGPRPFTPEQEPIYASVPGSDAYYHLRPGLTGLWQVGRRNRGSFVERVKFDADYRTEMSLIADLSIILQTGGVVIQATGV